MTSIHRYEERLREAQEHNAASRIRPASRSYRALLRDLAALDPADHGRWVIELRVRSLIGEASCIHALTGDLAASLRLVDEARLAAASGSDRRLDALVAGQAGLLHQRSGDLGSAIAEFDRALRQAAPDNHRDLAVLHLNRGAAWSEAGDLARAVEDDQAALVNARACGNDRYAAFALYNLGLDHWRRGDLPAAMRAMAESADLLPERDAWSEVGRAHVLFEAGLITEADRVLAEAADLIAADDLVQVQADALEDRARCALGLARHEDAIVLAAESQEKWARAGNHARSLTAAMAGLEATLARARESLPGLADARRGCDEALELVRQADQRRSDLNWSVGIGARLLAVEFALLADDTGLADRIMRDLPRLPGATKLPVRIHCQVVRAQLAFGRGDRRAGLAAVRRGQRVLADHRSRLGSIDTVTAAAAHGVRLAVVDVRAALGTGRARSVFDAMERGRSVFAGAARVRPPEDTELAGLLARARRATEEARELGAERGADSGAAGQERSAEAIRLQESARQRSWQLSGEADVPRPTTARDLVGRLREADSDLTVVSYLLLDGEVRAVRLDASGARMVSLGPLADLVEQARRVQSDLGILSNPLIPPPMREVAATSARRSLARIDEQVVAPLRVYGPMQVAARGVLLSTLWTHLPSRDGLGTTVDSWVDLHTDRGPTRTGRVLVVAGPDLDRAAQEADVVTQGWVGATLLAGPDATCDAVRSALDGAGVVHLATHGVHETDNPLFSSVRLTDGPLFAHELDGTDLRGAVVVLSACEVGRSSARLDGEPLGLTSVLLRFGAVAVIAAVAPLRDDVAARVMPRLHAELRATGSPAGALAKAVADEPEPVPLVCFGPPAL